MSSGRAGRRPWTPTVPTGWSTRAVAVFQGEPAADFHNARVVVLDSRWQQVRLALSDPSIPEWYAPFGIAAIGGHVFVTYAWRATASPARRAHCSSPPARTLEPA